MTQELPDQPSEPQPTYKPGDVVNGYILTEQHGWQPVQEATGREWGSVSGHSGQRDTTSDQESITEELPSEEPQPTHKPEDVVNGYILTEHLGGQPVPETPAGKAGMAWWRSTWVVAAAAGILGLLVGTGIGTSNTADTREELAAVQEQLDESQAEVRRLSGAAATASTQLGQRESEVKAREDAVAEKEQAVKAREDAVTGKEQEVAAREQAVAQKEQAVTAREQAVADAEQRLANDRAVPEQPAPAVPPPPAPQRAATDPRFSTCAEAKAAGFGPYRSGVDPEYDWYRDQDSDGVVCE